MPATAWKVPNSAQPKPDQYRYDLDAAVSSVLGLSTIVPADAFTAETLGTERAGNGVLIRDDGIVLTIGYLITEAQSVWLSLNNGRVVEGHVIGYDQESGFGLVQALGRLDVPALPLGRSAEARAGDKVVVAGAGGRQRAVAARITAKQEFAGYWEYLIDEAIFTAPSHPHWGGTALIGVSGELLGIGSLQLQHEGESERAENINMIVPIDLLAPILDDLLTLGRPNRPPRPWLGLYATEVEDKVVVAGLAGRGPAEKAGLQVGDFVLAVGDTEVGNLAGMFRAVWDLGEAGVSIPLRLTRNGRGIEVAIQSVDRSKLLKRPQLH